MQEQENNSYQQQQPQERPKRPTGVAVLGGLNCFVFGALWLLVLSFVYFRLNLQTWETTLDILSERMGQINIEYGQFKKAVAFQMLLSVVFGVSGAGVLMQKNWGRRTTLYLAFFILILVLFSAISYPAVISQMVFHILYAAILIIYFTNKSVEQYFKK